MRLLKQIIALPSFLFGVFVMFWCFQLGALTMFIKFWRTGPRNDIEGVCTFLKWAFQFKVLKVGDEKLCEDKRVMYLANHRSWADFFCEMYIIGARAVPLSRRAVGMAFPAFSSSLLATRSILLFNRGGVKDTEKFNAWVDRASARAHAQSLLVYPEGTRSLRDKSLPLRRGMLRYAHTRRMPVQVVITAYKEEIMNERRRSVHFGRTLVMGCSEVLESTQHEDFEDFMDEVQRMWDEQWARVHAAPRQGLPEHVASFPTKQYSPATLALQTLAILGWMPVMAAQLLLTFRALCTLAGWGLGGQLLLGALGVATATSFVAAWLPAAGDGGWRRSQDGKQE